MNSDRFRPGSYVIYQIRGGATLYWRGDFDEFYLPRATGELEEAAIFISARHAYCCAGEHPRLKSWRVRRIGNTRCSLHPQWDAHFSDRLVARLLQSIPTTGDA